MKKKKAATVVIILRREDTTACDDKIGDAADASPRPLSSRLSNCLVETVP